MPDEPIAQTTPSTPDAVSAVAPAETPTPDTHADAIKTAEDSVRQFIADQQPPETPRDEKGRFASTKPSPEPQPAAAQAPVMDPLLVEAAKQVYFSEDEIKTFEGRPHLLESAIYGRRSEIARRNGATAAQTPAQQQPKQDSTPTAQVPATVEDFKLEIDEKEVAEELAGPLKSMAAKINQVSSVLNKTIAENVQLRQQVAQLGGAVQQSVASVQMAEQIKQAEMMDSIVSDIPGLMEHLGKPSDALRNPGSDKYVRWTAMRGPIEQLSQRAVAMLGPNGITPSVVKQIVTDAYRMMGFGSAGGTNGSNGSNGKQVVGPGSVPRGTPRRSDHLPPDSGSFDDAVKHAERQVAEAFAAYGGNPFANLD